MIPYMEQRWKNSLQLFLCATLFLFHNLEHRIGLIGTNALPVRLKHSRHHCINPGFNVSNPAAKQIHPILNNEFLKDTNRSKIGTIGNRKSLNLFSVVGESQETIVNFDESQPDKEYYIRNAEYGDLTTAANLLVKAFYPPSPLLKFFRQLKELDRLQSNFPYTDPNHSMYVAVSKRDGKVIGFVDIDFRRTKRRYAPPRPYLSDLVVNEKWRRRGIATELILKCEQEALELKEKSLYLRVESNNEKALSMYYSLGYEFEPSKIFGVIDTTMLLKRNLQTPRSEFETVKEPVESI